MSTASAVKSRVLAGSGTFWDVQDFSPDAESFDAVRTTLSRLERAGELLRVRHGLYWRGRKTQFGMTQPDYVKAAERLVGRGGVGPAGVAAANLLGVSTQLPGVYEVAVPSRAPSAWEGVRFLSRESRRGRRQHNLNEYEVALLEVLGDWGRLVEDEPTEAASALRESVESGAIRIDRLVKASSSESAATRTLLRWLLAQWGLDDLARGVAPALVDRTAERVTSGV